jgi:quinol monooxygenase YgiN
METEEPVVVVARWQTTKAALDTVLAHAAALRPQALAEPGCLGYAIFQSVDDPTEIVLIERYRDSSALDAHVNSAHYQDLVVERIRPLLTERHVETLRPREAT